MNEPNALRIGLSIALVIVVTVRSLVLFGPVGILVALAVLGGIWVLGAMLRAPGTPTA